MLKSGVPYWKIRLTAGDVFYNAEIIGHAYVTFYDEEKDRWVLLDWCFYPNKKPISDRTDYKNNDIYMNVWFSWNQKYCFSKGTKTKTFNKIKR